jgi:hypothetical protein
MGGHRPRKLESEREWLLARHAREKDITLHAVLAVLEAVRGVVVSCDTQWRFLRANGITFKKKTIDPLAVDRAHPDAVCRGASLRGGKRCVVSRAAESGGGDMSCNPGHRDAACAVFRRANGRTPAGRMRANIARALRNYAQGC